MEDGGWRLAANVRENRKELCLLVVNGKAHEAAGGVKGFQQGGQDIKGVRDHCHVSAYSRSDTDTSDVNFFLLPTRSASTR